MLAPFWEAFGTILGIKTHAKISLKFDEFFHLNSDELSSEMDSKGSPRGPKHRGFREPFGPQPPKTSPEDSKLTQNIIFLKMYPQCTQNVLHIL